MRLRALTLGTLAALTILCLTGDGSNRTVEQQRGFALPTYERDAYQSAETSIYLEELVAVGADWVQIIPTWYQTSRTSIEVRATSRTASDESIRHVIRLAHRLGLKVMLKPHIDLDTGEYRGTIEPDDRSEWFGSYERFIRHYARLAAEVGAEQFAVGTELASLSDDRSAWISIINLVRKDYDGSLLYAANFDEYRQVEFWGAVDLIGIDAYWPLVEEPSTDVEVLKDSWVPIRDHLKAFADRAQRPIVFSEAGYTSQQGAVTAPWSWTVSSREDQAEQAAAYHALWATFQQEPWWGGVFWWVWEEPPQGKSEDPLSYSPRGKSAEHLVRSLWR